MFNKRVLALLLAFTFIIGCIPNLGITDVYAVDQPLNLWPDKILVEGNNNDNPTYEDSGQQQSAFMFEWTAEKEGESSTLEYWVKDKVKMVVTTVRDGELVYVTVALNDGTKNIDVVDSKYQIYNNFKKEYVTIDKFFDAGVPSNAYNGYDYKQVVNEQANNFASFVINNKAQDVGYSIKYNDFELHFLLDQDDTFRFYQKGNFNTGRVYKAYFNRTNSLNGSKDYVRYFSIGLSLDGTDGVQTEPFVDVDSNSDTDPTAKEYKDDKYSIEDRGLVNIDSNDSVGFDYSIPLPFEYDEFDNNGDGKYTFSELLSKEATVTVSFAKGNTSSAESSGEYMTAIVKVPVVGDAYIQELKGEISKEADATCYFDRDPKSNRLKLYFSNLDSGMLLTPTITFELETSAQAVIKDYGTTDKKAYTFPNYEIINNDGQDYIVITPFAGYAGDYVLYSGPLQSNPATFNKRNLSYASKYFKDNAQSTDKIWLPLSPVSASGSVVYDYKLFFNPNEPFGSPSTLMLNENVYDATIQTRYFEYTSKDRGTIGFPNDFTVTNVNQSKMFVQDNNYLADGSGNYVEDFQDTSYTLAWDLGKVTSIDTMLASGSAIVTYDIKIGNAVDVVEDDFLRINFNVDGTGGSTLAKLNDAQPFVAEFTKKVGDKPKSPLNDVIDARIITVYSTQSSAFVYRLEVDLQNVAIDAEQTKDYVAILDNLYFQYPNIYFFTVSPVLSGSSASVISTVKSLTLNKDVAVELKEPVKIRTSNIVTQFKGDIDALGQTVVKDQVSMDLTYEQQQATLAEYMNYYFTNYDLAHYGQNMKFTNDIYISQDYNLMSKVFPEYKKSERNAASTAFEFNGYVNSGGLYEVMMKKFSSNPAGADPDPLTSNGQTGIDVLRDGGVVKIADVPMKVEKDDSYTLPTSNVVNTLRINGLDTNAKYYFYVDTNVIYEKNGHYRYLNQSFDKLEEHSGISALVSGTTGSNLATPSILDEVPTMPDISLVETGRNNYKVTWENVTMNLSDTARYSQEIRYEVLRVRDVKLEDKYLDSRQDLQQVFANQIDSAVTDKSAQLLYRDATTQSPAVLLYNPTTNTFVTPTKNMYVQEYDDDNNIIYTDNSLSANKVYFVYARTVRVITDLNTKQTYNVYSPWDAISATTVLGEPPIDLRVVYNYTGVYNDQTQIPLSFRAKVPDVNAIGKDFTFQVTYKYDGNEWVVPITIDSAALKNTNNYTDMDSEGYRTFTFLLSGLIPGKAYSIKVRQANSDGSYTPYSNTVQWKTEIDEDEYDKEDELGSYEDLMDDLVNRIIDGSQIELVNNSKEKVIMVNGNNLSNEISNSHANTIMMNVLEKGKKNTIIIPFEAYETASDKNLGWQFSYNDMFFNMSADTIDPTYNSNVINMNKKIDRDFVDDYYMEVVFEYRGTPATLQGDDRLTDVVNISSNLRATNENVLDFQESALIETLEEVKNSELAIAKKQAVLKSIATGMSSEDALKLVDEYVEYVKTQFKTSFNNKLSKIRQARDDESVYSLDKNIIMGTNYQNLLSAVTAYSVNTYSLAMPMSTTRSTNVTTAVVKDFGTYGFGGDAVNIVGNIDNQNGNNNVSQIIATNDLEDSLSNIGAVVDTSATISVAQALVAMGNITGMTDTEMKTVLSGKGITINRNNESKSLSEDLSAAMLGVLYEEVNGVNPDNVTIKDYNFYNSLTSSGISPGYIKHIQLAKEMGLITELPSTSKTVTIGKFLGILSKI